jgi:iron complex transport system substrate-binding protein
VPPVEGRLARVATLDFITTETVALRGAAPVAVADVGAYWAWVLVGSDALASARPLGHRSDPDCQALAHANPDLITDATFRHQPLTGELRRIVRHLGDCLGAQQRAETLIRDMDSTLANQAARIAKAGLAGTPVILARQVSGTNQFTHYTSQSLGASVIRSLGLRNAHDAADRRFGYKTLTLRDLSEAPVLLAADFDDPTFEEIQQSAIWQSLPTVRTDRIHPLPPKTWFFGGPSPFAGSRAFSPTNC